MQYFWFGLIGLIAGALAGQVLPVPADIQPWLAFAVGVVNLALTVFFGVTGFRARAAAKAAK